MIEGLSRAAGTLPQRTNANATKDAGTSFADWLRSGSVEAKEPALQDAVADFAPPSPGAFQSISFDFHFRRGQAALELVSVPWKLAASGRLSHAGQAAVPYSAAAAIIASPIPAHSTPNGLAAAQAQPLRPQVTGVREQTPLPSVTPQVGEQIDSAPPIDDGLQTASGSPLAPQAAPWAERLMHWLQRQGHDPELWVRDYALDDKAARHIADAMRTLAKEQGIHLQRIVVNARELWRAPYSTAAGEQG